MSLRLQSVCTERAPGSLGPELNNVSLDMPAGSFNVLLGPTGAGKTELLRAMGGLDPVSSGSLSIRDRDVTGVSVRKRDVAFVYQAFINYPEMTVHENIASPLRVRGVSRQDIHERVLNVARRLDLAHLLERKPAELSGGQQQRVALGRALIREAELVLLDEPLVNLDYKLREKLRADIRELFAGRDGIVVFATSDPAEALQLGGELFVLHEGRLLQHGAPEAVYGRPANLRSAKIVGDPPMNLLPYLIEGGVARVPGSKLEFPHTSERTRGWVGIQPHRIHLVAEPGDLRFRGAVALAELSGSETYVHVSVGERSLIVQLHGTHTFGIDEPIEFFIYPGDLFFFDESGDLIHAPEAMTR